MFHELLNKFVILGMNEEVENVYLTADGAFSKDFSEAAVMSRHEADNALHSIENCYFRHPLVVSHEYGMRETVRKALSVRVYFNYDGFEIRYSLDPKFVDEPIKHDNFSAWLDADGYFSITVETEEKFVQSLGYPFDSYPEVLDEVKKKKSRDFSFQEDLVVLTKDPPVTCEWEKFISILENVSRLS